MKQPASVRKISNKGAPKGALSKPVLLKRYPYSNEYNIGLDVKGRQRKRTVFGGAPNIEIDARGNLEPLNNKIVTDNKSVSVFRPIRVPGKVSFQDRATKKYLTTIETFTGEKLFISIPNLPSATPIIKPDGVTIKWVFPNGCIVESAVTEKHIKEEVFQKKGEVLKFRYATEGLDVVKGKGLLEFRSKKTGKLVFKTQRPYYVQKGETEYVPVIITKIGQQWNITYPAPKKDRLIDPTIEFSERGGAAVGGDHKDTWIRADAAAQSNASGVLIYTHAGAPAVLIGRFSLASHIPTNAIVNSSTLTITNGKAPAAPAAIIQSIHDLITNWGITPTVEGVSENPATLGQATFDNAFDRNGVGDVGWVAGVGAGWSAGDRRAVENTWNMDNSDAIGTVYTVAIPIMTQRWVNNDATNYGFVVESNRADWLPFDSQESVTVAERPYLTVNWTSIAPVNVGCNTPANGATNQSITPTLTALTATEPGVGLHATPYYFEIAEDTAFTINVQNSGWQASNSWVPGRLANDRVYYWRVRVRNAHSIQSALCGHTPDIAGYGSFRTVYLYNWIAKMRRRG